jgi:hypothetical protein
MDMNGQKDIESRVSTPRPYREGHGGGSDGWRIFSAMFMLLAGTGLSIAGFIQPPVGEISDSVLMFTAQALVYAGSAFGIDIMIDNRIRKAQHKEQSDTL